MEMVSLSEALSQEMNSTLKNIMRDINSNSSLKKFVESVRPEVYMYKNHYSVMVILRSKLSNDQEEFAMDAIKTVANKYNAKVKRNNLVVKVLLKQETEDEVQADLK
jgi:hypothetical protein